MRTCKSDCADGGGFSAAVDKVPGRQRHCGDAAFHTVVTGTPYLPLWYASRMEAGKPCSAGESRLPVMTVATSGPLPLLLLLLPLLLLPLLLTSLALGRQNMEVNEWKAEEMVANKEGCGGPGGGGAAGSGAVVPWGTTMAVASSRDTAASTNGTWSMVLPSLG